MGIGGILKIIEKWQDVAKEWRVKKVQLDDGECIILKFQQEPKDEEVMSKAEEYVTNAQKRSRVISEKREKMDLNWG